MSFTTGFAGRMESSPLGRAERIARLRRLAVLLDSAIRLPGGFRIGADGLESAAGDSPIRREARRPEVLGLEAGRVGVRDVLRQELLPRLMPMHPGLEHRDERRAGEGQFR